MTIWIFAIEPIDSRYTRQWFDHLPKTLSNRCSYHQSAQLSGHTVPPVTTPGAFLDFTATNIWKSTQLAEFMHAVRDGKVQRGDHVLFTDAWNPAALQVRYTNDLMDLGLVMHGMWHAGSYDPADFLGRLIGNDPWVRHTEKAYFHAFHHNYFATEFHIEMFVKNLFEVADVEGFKQLHGDRIVRTGWPMEYTVDMLQPYSNIPKKQQIVFPHRIAPEKQLHIFKELEKLLPQYEFIVCQEKKLTKHEYHTIMGQSMLCFSANLQETLGIGQIEATFCNTIPLCPDRLSYREMYLPEFKYDGDMEIKDLAKLVDSYIIAYTNDEQRIKDLLKQQKDKLMSFISAENLYKKLEI